MSWKTNPSQVLGSFGKLNPGRPLGMKSMHTFPDLVFRMFLLGIPVLLFEENSAGEVDFAREENSVEDVDFRLGKRV